MKRLGRTAKGLLKKLEAKAKGQSDAVIVVEFGLHRGKLRTGKLRSYGKLAYEGAKELIYAGRAEMVGTFETSKPTHRLSGLSESRTKLTLRLPAPAMKEAA